MSNVLRILMATPRYLPQTGGVEMHVNEVARRMAAAGHAVTVLTTDAEGDKPLCEALDGVEVLRARAWPQGRDWRYARGLRRITSGRRWDLLHVQSYHTMLAPQAMAWARMRRLPYVLSFHAGGSSSGLRTLARPAQQWAIRPLLAGADRLVVMAPFEVEVYSRRLRLGAERFAVVPNGADLPTAPAGGDRTDPDLIASVGRLERYKGHHRVIAALPHLARMRPGIRLWIAGTGPYEAELRALAERLGVRERVDIRAVPPQDRAAMAARVSQAALVTLMSDFETHPIAALEAAALGRRLLVADSPGLRPLADQGLATCVPAELRADRLAAAMDAALSAPAPTHPPVLPTWDDCAAGLVGVYRQVLEARCGS